jgi:hypothetical protein
MEYISIVLGYEGTSGKVQQRGGRVESWHTARVDTVLTEMLSPWVCGGARNALHSGLCLLSILEFLHISVEFNWLRQATANRQRERGREG